MPFFQKPETQRVRDECFMSVRTTLKERVISGALTASMVLSMFTGLGTPAEAAEVGAAALPVSKTASSARGQSVAAGKRSSSEGIAMPLVLDRTQIGFAEGVDGVEVTAYMTDIQYLGVLDLEEYAAFIPVSISLDKALWLDRELRSYVAEFTEEQRQAARGRALAKLQLEEQFIWDFVYGEEDYSDSLTITPVAFTVYDATRDTAPMIAARVKLEWTGERPVNKIYAPDNDLSSLMGGESAGGNKDLSAESPEVQEFLRQLYESGLTQDRSDYDLSQFANESANNNFNLLGVPEDDESESETATNTAAPDSSDSSEGAGAVVPSEENEPQQSGDEGQMNVYDLAYEEDYDQGEPAPVAEDTAPVVDTKGLAQAAAAAAAARKAQTQQVTIEEDEVPQAAAPEGEDGEEETGEVEDFYAEYPNAYFHVKMKANESINTYGRALYFPSTQTVPSSNSTEQNEQEN